VKEEEKAQILNALPWFLFVSDFGISSVRLSGIAAANLALMLPSASQKSSVCSLAPFPIFFSRWQVTGSGVFGVSIARSTSW